MGTKKFGMSFETRETKLFGRISRDFAEIFRGVPETFEKKGSLCSILVPYSEKLKKAVTVDCEKHPAWKVGTRSRAVWTQCDRFAFPGARNPRI